MSILPVSTQATSSTATEGDVKSFLAAMRDFVAEFLGTDSANKVAALALMGSAMNGTVGKTVNYTVVSADRGKVLRCSGNITINIAAAATLGDGFVFAVWNNGTGTVTIDPNLSEQIDGAVSKQILAGKFALVYCDSARFVTVGSLGFNDLLAMGGDSGVNYRRLPGGLTVQWGSAIFPPNGSPGIINFPVDFQTACFYVDARPNQASSANGQTYNYTKTGFTAMSLSNPSTATFNWIASGY